MNTYQTPIFFLSLLVLGACALEPLEGEISPLSPPSEESSRCEDDSDCSPGVCSAAGLCVGQPGERGPAGPRGENGETGQDGADGTSCTVEPHPSGAESCALISCGETRQEICVPAGQDGQDGADGTSCTVKTLPSGEHLMLCADGTSATWADGEMGPMGPRGTEGRDGEDAASCTVRQNGNGTATLTCPDGTSVTWDTAASEPLPECVRASDCEVEMPYCDGGTRVVETASCEAGTCRYRETRTAGSDDCRVRGDQCVRASDCEVEMPYCDGTTFVSERSECDFGYCVYSTHSGVNTEICPAPPTGWHVNIHVLDSGNRDAEVHLYHNDPDRTESADTFSFAPHTFRLSELEACVWGVEIAVRSLPEPSHGPWWGCDPGTPSKSDLRIWVHGELVTPEFRPHDWSCSGMKEGNLFLSPDTLGCPQ